MNNIVRIVNRLDSLLNSMGGLDIKDLWQQRVMNCANKFIRVNLSPSELQFVLRTANNVAEVKAHETAHKKDGISEIKRFLNGFKGEAAVAKLLGIDIIDPTVGVSVDFDKPDIPGFNVGIKCAAYGHFPVIPKDNKYPQVICIAHPLDDAIVYVCGLADVDTLNKYQNMDLILDPNLKAKGTKTGFWGFSELKELSFDTLEPYKNV